MAKYFLLFPLLFLLGCQKPIDNTQVNTTQYASKKLTCADKGRIDLTKEQKQVVEGDCLRSDLKPPVKTKAKTTLLNFL